MKNTKFQNSGRLFNVHIQVYMPFWNVTFFFLQSKHRVFSSPWIVVSLVTYLDQQMVAEVVLCKLQSLDLKKPWRFDLHDFRTLCWDYHDVKNPGMKGEPFKLPAEPTPILSAQSKHMSKTKLNQQNSWVNPQIMRTL